jgi:cell wall-associated NlpC family hydrolase
VLPSARQRHLLLATLLGVAVSVTAASASAQSGAAPSGAARPSARETDGSAAPRIAVDTERPRAFSALGTSLFALRDSLVTRARESIGIRYIFGGTDPLRGLDCSALIRHVLSAFDISLPRTASEQARMGREIPKDRAQMQPGDLLTFGTKSHITHIGMYVGEGRFIHASTSRKQVIESTLDQTRSSLVKQWQGVRRLVDRDFVAVRYDSVFAMLDSLRTSVGDSLWSRASDTSQSGTPDRSRAPGR